MARDEPVVNMHMPASLKRALEEAAAREQRTLTKEIVIRLERSLIADDIAGGVRDDAPDYVTTASALNSLPDDLRSAAVRLLCAAGNGMPRGDAVDAYRKNQAPLRNGIRSKAKAKTKTIKS